MSDKKLFISADIEGTCGIVHWNETEKNHADWSAFAEQMTREVTAACRGAHAAGYASVLIKDAHDSARNLNLRALPEYAEVIRGWSGHPACMMFGLDESFDGVVLTGYHSGSWMPGNPLSHTMNTTVLSITINGELATETMINGMIASHYGVPVYVVTGDKGLCDSVRAKNPNISVVPVNEGMGGCVRAIHPDRAVRLIEDAVREAVQRDKADCMYPMPDAFDTEIVYREHTEAMRMSFYPGAERSGARSVRFKTTQFFELLRFYHFTL